VSGIGSATEGPGPSRPAIVARLALLAVLAPPLTGCGDEQAAPQPVWPSRQERGHIHVLRLAGTPYEMGRQHGELMAAELAQGVEWLHSDPIFSLLLALTQTLELLDEAHAYSYADVQDECRGLADGAQAHGVDLSLDECLTLAYADVIVEVIDHELGAGCTQLAATGQATADGSLLHARNMDNGYLGYLIDHPTIIVRRPTGQIPFLEVGFPGSVSPHSGMNAAGIAVASNENTAVDDFSGQGRSHIQMSRQILASCHSLEEVEAFLAAQQHGSAESLLVSDGPGQAAAAFEMTSSHLGIRQLDDDDVVYLTNHFVHPDMADLHLPTEPTDSTRSRFARLEQLLPPSAEQSVHGALDVASAIAVLRDHHNPVTGETHPPELFDGGGTIANNAALHSMVFVPERREVFVALGEPPVPQRPFIGFSLDGLLEDAGLGETNPTSYP